MTTDNNSNLFINRQYMILSVSELYEIDFSQVLENSFSTVRKSVDGTLTFVKWEGDTVPSSVQTLQSKQGPYSYEEIMDILSMAAWVQEI